MLDLKKMEVTIAQVVDETANLAAASAQPNHESNWHPGAIIAAAASAGAALAVAFMAVVVFVLKQIQG